MKASDEVAAKLADLEQLAGPVPDEATREVIRKGHAGIVEMRRAEDGLELVKALVGDLAAVAAPVYSPDDPRGFSFVTEAEEERPEARTGGPTRYRPRLGPRKPAGRVWGILLLVLPTLFGCSEQPPPTTTTRDLIALGLYARVSSPFGEREESHDVEVCWIRESDATTRFLHGGEVVDTYSTYNDFYGPGTCMAEADERGSDVAEKFAVTAESSAVVEVLVEITDRPILNPRAGQYKRTEYDEIDRQAFYLKDANGERTWLDPIPVASVVVWSTKPIDVDAAKAHVMSFFEPARFGEGGA